MYTSAYKFYLDDSLMVCLMAIDLRACRNDDCVAGFSGLAHAFVLVKKS